MHYSYAIFLICCCSFISTSANDIGSSYSMNSPLLLDPSPKVIRDIAKESMSTYMKAIQMRPDWLEVLLYNVRNESQIRKTKFGCPEKNEFCIYKLDFLANDKAMELIKYLKAHRGELLLRMRRSMFQTVHDSQTDSAEQAGNYEQTQDNSAQYDNQKPVESILSKNPQVMGGHTSEHSTLSRACTEPEKENNCKDSHLCDYFFLLSQIVCKCRTGFTGYACNMLDLHGTLTKLMPHHTKVINFGSLGVAEAGEIRSVLEALARYTLNAFVEQQLQQKIYG